MPSRLAAFAMTFGIAALMVYALVTGRDLLIPFAIAVMVWYLINALKRGFERWARAPGWLALTLAIFAILALIGLVVEIISGNIAAVGEAAPTYQANVEKLIGKAMEISGLKQMPTIGQIVEQFDLRALIKAVAGAAANVAGNAGLIVIYVMFLLVEQSTFDRKIDALFPEKGREEMVHEVLADIQQRIQTYVAVKTGLSLATGAISYFIMLSVGLDLAGFWAFLIFLLNYIPTIGSLLGVVFPSLLAIIQFGDVVPVLVVIAGLGICQIVIGNVIEPKLMGKSLNVSSLVVIVSLAVWGSIWGVTGMFLCVPITVILMIVLAEFKQTRPVAILLSADGKV
jgi:AI-2 transport protein TqsA